MYTADDGTVHESKVDAAMADAEHAIKAILPEVAPETIREILTNLQALAKVWNTYERTVCSKKPTKPKRRNTGNTFRTEMAEDHAAAAEAELSK